MVNLETTEVRRGNYFLFTKNGVETTRQVAAISEHAIYFRDEKMEMKSSSADCWPIQLNDDWLFKLGAIERTFHLPNECYLDISTTYKTAYIQNGLGFSIKYPEFVHQLQNLYFALTGQELKIKEA